MSNLNESPHLTTRSALVEERLRSSVAHSAFYHRLAKKIKSRHLAAYVMGYGCCQPFFYNDLHNDFISLVNTPSEANMLVIFGPVSAKWQPMLEEAYLRLSTPKMVVAIGSCTKSLNIPIDLALDLCPREQAVNPIFADIKELWLRKVAVFHQPQTRDQQ